MQSEVFDIIDEPLVVVTGDTTIEGLLVRCCTSVCLVMPDALTRFCCLRKAYEPASRAKLLVMEVTSIDASLDPEKCNTRGHIHIEDVVRNAEFFRGVTVGSVTI